MKEISIILPTYNEEGNIALLIKGIGESLNGRDHEIIVVDDDSPDGTWKIVQELGEANSSIRVIRRIGKSGLTSAISEGIENSGGRYVCWLDADLSMPPEVIKQLLEKVDGEYDIAVASRYVAGGGMVIIESSQDSYLSAILSFVMNVTIQKLLDPSFKDYTSGFIVAKREIFEKIKLKGDYGEYFIDLIYRAIKMGYKVTEIPYISLARKHGVSKTGTNFFQYAKRGVKYIWTTLRLRFTKI